MKQSIYTENTLSPDTGEVILKRWITREVSSSDMFMRRYTDDRCTLSKCSRGEQSIINAIWDLRYVEYSTNELFINRERRLELCKVSGLSLNTINTSLARLVKKNILIKKGSSHYILSPEIFFFGSDIDRATKIQLCIEYKIVH